MALLMPGNMCDVSMQLNTLGLKETRDASKPLISFEIDTSLLFRLTESAPPPRVASRDTAIATSVVTTLGRVAVSDKKRGGIYITLGRESRP